MLNFFMVIPSRTPPGFVVEGCPVANGGPECSRGCGGWYRISTAALTQAFLASSLNPAGYAVRFQIVCDKHQSVR